MEEPSAEENREFLESLDQLVLLATHKIQASKLLERMQRLLQDPEKNDEEKLLMICNVIDQGLKDSVFPEGLSDHNLCKLFKREFLDFVYGKIKGTLIENKAEIIACLENAYKWLDGQMIKPSRLRDLLNELKDAVQYCTKKNRWPVPTGVKRLSPLLENLDWLEDSELLMVLKECKQIIAKRISYFYLYRSHSTYFLYRNFYSILVNISEDSFVEANKSLCGLEQSVMRKQAATDQAFNGLYVYLSEFKSRVYSPHFDKKGRILGIFANKPPDGINRLRIRLQQLPPRTPTGKRGEIELIKLFMQLRDILYQKVVLSENIAFRDPEIRLLYSDLYTEIENIYSILQKEDEEIFFVVGMMAQKEASEILETLAISSLSTVLVKPEKIHNQVASLLESPMGRDCLQQSSSYV